MTIGANKLLTPQVLLLTAWQRPSARTVRRRDFVGWHLFAHFAIRKGIDSGFTIC
jgi:hypothetical protein